VWALPAEVERENRPRAAASTTASVRVSRRLTCNESSSWRSSIYLRAVPHAHAPRRIRPVITVGQTTDGVRVNMVLINGAPPALVAVALAATALQITPRRHHHPRLASRVQACTAAHRDVACAFLLISASAVVARNQQERRLRRQDRRLRRQDRRLRRQDRRPRPQDRRPRRQAHRLLCLQSQCKHQQAHAHVMSSFLTSTTAPGRVPRLVRAVQISTHSLVGAVWNARST